MELRQCVYAYKKDKESVVEQSGLKTRWWERALRRLISIPTTSTDILMLQRVQPGFGGKEAKYHE